MNDSRLTLAIIKSAHEHGALVANYTQAIGLNTDKEDYKEIRFRELLTTGEGIIRARVIVAAVGPWTSELFELHRLSGPPIRPTKGVHLVLHNENHTIVCGGQNHNFIHLKSVSGKD